jgi:indolepyruvate ferredoxin oxidoreductase
MNAVTLDDKYTATEGRIFLSGTQALVRLPIEQARRDSRAGHDTAGFISGYRGSPLGGYDTALWAAGRHLEASRIHFEPGVNEDLAATAVWGTQKVPLLGGARHQGVFGIWYGKGPGVDRSTDALKHANFAGTSPLGGVLALCGDDHAARSSTLAHQSDHALIHCGMPIFNPADIQDYIDLGLMGFALSRFASLWVGFKCVTDIVDGSANVLAGDNRIEPVIPEDFEFPPGGLSIRHEVAALSQEARLFEQRLEAARAFARVNGVDGQRLGAMGRRRLGIVTTGKGLADTSEALSLLGLTHDRMTDMGIGIYKVGMVWPLEPERMRQFAEECDEVLVIEEKRPVIEEQLAHLLYNSPADRRPRLMGKRDWSGAPLISEVGELNGHSVLMALASRIDALEGSSRSSEAARDLLARHGHPGENSQIVRTPSFCAGCPHSRSTRVPEGSMAAAGIGCHGMASFMPDRPTLPGTHMGGEGAAWIGQAPFVETPHLFQNMGDGTYFHSGLLALRACVAAGVNITYKILLNGAVGMTGGQPIEGEAFSGEITAPHVANQVHAEGVRRVAVVSDDPARFSGHNDDFPPGTTFHHRDELDRVQRDLRECRGVSVLIYDQSCATERRRLRKRGKLPQAEERLLIASEVCEGCGDCGVQSGCIAIEPLETDLGRKRRINQSVCNQDLSCLEGFCPSFVSVAGGTLRTRLATKGETDADLLEPVIADDAEFSLLVTGIGGAGVVTIGAILGMAAHLAGRKVTVLDMSGFAQRNGSVMSHLRIGTESALQSMRIPPEKADLVIGCDPIVTAGPDCIALMNADGSKVVLNRFVAPTSSMALDPDFLVDGTLLERRIARKIGEDNLLSVDATGIANSQLGNAVGANMVLVGNAWQAGLIPIPRVAIEEAIRLNGSAVEMNLKAFTLGRILSIRPEVLARGNAASEPDTLASLIERRADHLAAYQDERLAGRYRTLVLKVMDAEQLFAPGSEALTRSVAVVYARLLAYKDEYEVARLLTGGSVESELRETFEGDYRIRYNLAPPLISRRDPATGRLRKRSFGPWLRAPLRLLASLKRLRGTPFDIFGYHPHRRMERALIAEYAVIVDEVLARLRPDNHAQAVELASAHGLIRGFDVVKEANVEKARDAAAQARAALLACDAAPIAVAPSAAMLS